MSMPLSSGKPMPIEFTAWPVVRTFTEFLNMMVIEKAHLTMHGEYVRWRPVPYSHVEAVREI